MNFGFSGPMEERRADVEKDRVVNDGHLPKELSELLANRGGIAVRKSLVKLLNKLSSVGSQMNG